MLIDILVTLIVMPWWGMVMMFPMLLAAPGFKDDKKSVLHVIVIFFYPALFFLGYLIFDRPYFGISPFTTFLISVILCLIPISLFDLRRLVLNLFRGITNSGYCQTATHVYWDGKLIEHASPASFEKMSEDYARYARDSNMVYSRGTPAPDADPESFTVLGDSYAKDKFRVYHYHHMKGMTVVENADPKTFTIVTKKPESFF